MSAAPSAAIWQNVDGNYDAARQAAAAMRQAATSLAEVRDRRQTLATVARGTWTGRFAREFDRRMESLQRESAELQAQLMAAARRLELAAEDATTDQRARVVAREEARGGQQEVRPGFRT
jgi:uncharacterized protein YukE